MFCKTVQAEEGNSLQVNTLTGEYIVTDSEGQYLPDPRKLRSLRYYYLHIYREYANSRSLTFCYMTPISRKGQAHLKPNTNGTIKSHLPLKVCKIPEASRSIDSVPVLGSSSVGDGVYVFKGSVTKKAHFHGVMKCSNVWACPVCSTRISTKRGQELQTAIDLHSKNGGFVYLVTLTIPHKSEDLLSVLLDDIISSYRDFTGGRIYQTIKKTHFIIGAVRALEVTFGNANGWHPHLHILIFTSVEADIINLKSDLFSRWTQVTKKRDYDPIYTDRLVDVRSGRYAGLYVAKISDTASHWNVSDELTKSHKKTGKLGRYSAHALLISFVEEKNRYHLKLFQEYEKTFQGRNQLVWSRGLKKHFGIAEKSDELLNNEVDELSSHMATIPTHIWKIISSNNLFSEVLEAAENGLRALEVYVLTIELKENSKSYDEILKAKYSTVHESESPIYTFLSCPVPSKVSNNLLEPFSNGFYERILKRRKDVLSLQAYKKSRFKD